MTTSGNPVGTKILCVVGARPNFMKIAPIMRALAKDARFQPRLLHTGQHYDEKLSRIFFDELAIPRPDIELEVGSGTLAVQTAEIMRRAEPVLIDEQPHAVLVVGDVNSTIACAFVASRFHRREAFHYAGEARTRPVVIHVEAGLRSFDDDMPEEINRKLTDAISDVLFVSEPSGITNLEREGVASNRCFHVGNVMIDTLLAARERAATSPVKQTLGIAGAPYGVVTLHRPSNVDDIQTLRAMLGTLAEVAAGLRLVFPIHPRTRTRIESAGASFDPERLLLVEPLGYLDFLKLVADSSLVLTDSGGVQEETTVLGIPCITLRDNTERPITISEGTNRLGGTTRESILEAFEASQRASSQTRVPALWDGNAAHRIVEILARLFRA
jgi:UDP-N-acetylglucosamine 2-epimerase (non-hydrolysing)